AIFPSCGSVVPAPLSLHRVPWDGFPGFFGTVQCSDFSSSPVSLGCPCTAGSFVVGIVRSEWVPPLLFLAPIRPGPGLRCATRGGSRRKRGDLPGSWATLAHVLRSQTPPGPLSPTQGS